MEKVTIKFTSDWKKETPDMSTCIGCNEVVYGNQFRYILYINESKTETSIVVCEPCKALID